MKPSILGLPYIRLVFLSRMRPKGFTRTHMCGMNRGVTSARILLSLSPLPRYGHQSYVQETVTILRLSGNPLLSSLYDT